jgi:hypothetical protein
MKKQLQFNLPAVARTAFKMVAFAALFLVLSATAAFAQQKSRDYNVTLKKGSFTSPKRTVSRSVDTYKVQAKEGQRITVAIKGDCTFHFGVTNPETFELEYNELDKKSHSEKLPYTETYYIEVHAGAGGGGSYTLSVKVK